MNANVDSQQTTSANDNAVIAQSPTAAAPQTIPVLSSVGTAVAVLLILLFVAGLWFMAANRYDENWDRLVFLMSGLEAIVFAGAGALFGTTVQRQQVAAARDDANRAEAKASEERKRAEQADAKANKGELIGLLAKSKRDRAQARGESAHRGARPEDDFGGGDSLTDIDELAALADRFFPST